MKGRNKKTCPHKAGVRREGVGLEGRKEVMRCQSVPENAIYVDPDLTEEAEIKHSDVVQPPPLPHSRSLLFFL